MKYGLYAIRDERPDIYMEPMLFQNDEVAKRFFYDQCNKEGPIHDHKEDYSIWYLGEYDTHEGQIQSIVPKLIERG